MESKETIRAAKVLILAGGILIIGIVMGFILSGNLNFSPTSQGARSHRLPRSRSGQPLHADRRPRRSPRS